MPKEALPRMDCRQMSDDLRDRLQAETYADDEPVHVFRPDQYGPNEDGAWIPERIWHRLRALGSAYELHLLPLLDGTTDPVFLNPAQAEQFLDELRFVGELVDDPLVEAQVRALVSLAAERSHGASKDVLGFQFP